MRTSSFDLVFRRPAKLLALSALALISMSAEAVVNGPVDTVDTFVGQINGASGVAIAPNWVITARHVGVGPFITGGQTYIPVQSIVFDGMGGRPLGDVILERFQTANGSPNVFTKYVTPYFGNPLGQVASLIGFGGYGTMTNEGYLT